MILNFTFTVWDSCECAPPAWLAMTDGVDCI